MMQVYIKLFLVMLISISVSFVSAQSSQLLLVTKTQNIFYDGDIPTISGKVLDHSKKPVSDAQIQIQYTSEIVEAKSKADGSFNMSATKPVSIGEYGISIIASKADYETTIIPIEYSVVEKPSHPSPTNVDGIQSGIQDTGSMIVNGITNNPIAEILAKQMEMLQKQQEVQQELNQTSQQNDTLREQRKVAKESIEQDLVRMDKDFENYNPFNAFSRFVANFDDSIRSVFWGEFEITQKQHQEGQNAKSTALENGQSPKTAMKAYQDKAKISRNTIIELNNIINEKSKNVNHTDNSRSQ